MKSKIIKESLLEFNRLNEENFKTEQILHQIFRQNQQLIDLNQQQITATKHLTKVISGVAQKYLHSTPSKENENKSK